ncbi:aspartokinase 1 chloroplastic-like [Trifolium medium]|uniref:Aspartokinase 1 chloroplastic-like n=1 Tax=Trifolium medium TaxID=97028 RepID=A0A392Q7F4_9FABA|nr:aspartokinase 1 chloroplastic-like [Trifolium medium]
MAMQLGTCIKSVLFPIPTTRTTLHCETTLLPPPCRIGYTARVSHVPLVKRVSIDPLRVNCCSNNNGRESGVVAEKVEETEKSYTCVMKFGGSSVANAVRIREVANLILSFPEERPIIVLSAMGKTTNRLLLGLFE